MSARDEINARFLQVARVTNREKGYVVAEPFNIQMDVRLMRLIMQVFKDYYSGVVIDAIVGLPAAGTAYALPLAMALETETVLPAKKTVLPASWSDVAEYHSDSFTGGIQSVPAYIGGVVEGLRILAVDDVVAYGNTAVSAVKAMQERGAQVVGVASIFEKLWQGGSQRILTETGVPTFSVVSIRELTDDPHQSIILAQ